MALTEHFGVAAFNTSSYSIEDGNVVTYFSRREAESENFITIRRIRIYYRDIGVAVVNFTVAGQNQEGDTNSVTPPSVTIGTVNGPKRIVWTYSNDFEITITTPQLFITLVSGPVSIVKVVLVGDGKQITTI